MKRKILNCISYIGVNCRFMVLLLAFTAVLFGCKDELNREEPLPEAATDVYLAFNSSTRSGSINTNAEDRVKEIRLLIFDSQSGAVLYNKKHPVSDFTNQPATGAWRNPFKITIGKRDFYFVANETTADWNLSTALNGVSTRNDLFTLPALTKITCPVDFKPTDEAGNRAFLMTAAYRNIDVVSGGSLTNPLHFIADGDEEVDLLRTFAKVRLTIQNSVYRDNATGKDRFELRSTLLGLYLNTIPTYFALFQSPVFTGTTLYTQNLYNPFTVVGGNARDMAIENNRLDLQRNEIPYTAPTPAPPAGTIYKRDYQVTLYVPELLRPSNASETGDGLAFADATTLKFDFDVIDDKLSSIYNVNGLYHSSGSKFPIPNSTDFSKYSVLRNNYYDITAKERDYKLMLEFTVKDWDDVAKEYVYIGRNFNLKLQDGNFDVATQNITISTSMPNVTAPHKVELRNAVNTAFFTFTNTTYASWETRSWMRPTGAASGDTMFTLWYNDELVHTFKKQ